MVDADVTIDLDPDLDMKISEMMAAGNSMMDVARTIASRATSSAPVDSGEYAAGISVQRTKYGARVLASARNSAFVEFGVPSRGQPAQFNLRRAAFDGAGPDSEREMVDYTSKSGKVSHITRAQAANYGRNKVA